MARSLTVPSCCVMLRTIVVAGADTLRRPSSVGTNSLAVLDGVASDMILRERGQRGNIARLRRQLVNDVCNRGWDLKKHTFGRAMTQETSRAVEWSRKVFRSKRSWLYRSATVPTERCEA